MTEAALADLALTSDKTLVVGNAAANFAREAERVRTELRAGTTALMPAREPEGTWTARTLCERAMFFADASRREAKTAVEGALAACSIDKREARRSQHVLSPLGKKRALLAAALVTNPRRVVVCDPLSGLEDDAAEAMATLLVTALAGRVWVVFASFVSLWSPLARAADEVVCALGNAVVARGPVAALAAAESALRVRGVGNLEAFVTLAQERGLGPTRVLDGVDLTWPAGRDRNELFALGAEAAFDIDEMAPRIPGIT